jgi:hypothetical protein
MKTSTINKIITVACALWAVIAMSGAQAGGISDTGAGAYWGADGHGKTDVIGASTYDISGATITRIANVLTITIATNFAGHAGAEAALVGHGGIGYGDVFLAKAWNPFDKNDVNHASDNALNGTLWSYGLSLDNRLSNTGGTFKVYALGGTTNAASILNSDSFISCGTNCQFRNGQATAVDTSSTSKATLTTMSGNWTVTDNQLKFTLNLTGNSDLLNFTSFAMHWGETCQNDVIEGVTSVVSAPGSIPLLALGLGTMLLLRRRQAGLPART